MLNDALRVAQIHLPHRISEISSVVQTTNIRTGKGGTKLELLSVGKSFEQSKQWMQAIESYLNVRPSKHEPTADCEELWERAVEIARNHAPNRYVEVAVEVSRRMIDIGSDENAATILFDCGRQDDAINILVNAKKWEKAKLLCKGNALLKKRVDEAYQAHLVSREESKELAELGQTEVALEVLAKRGDWDRIWELILKEKIGPPVVSKFLVQRLEEVRTHFYCFCQR
jgi:intraflagellar transport protein 172